MLSRARELSAPLQRLQCTADHFDSGRVVIQYIAQKRSLTLQRATVNRHDIARIDTGIANVMQRTADFCIVLHHRAESRKNSAVSRQNARMEVEHPQWWDPKHRSLDNCAITDGEDHVGSERLHQVQARATVRISRGIDWYTPQPLYLREGEIPLPVVTQHGTLDQGEQRQVGPGLLSNAQLTPLWRFIHRRTTDLLCKYNTHRVARKDRQQTVQRQATRQVASQTTQNAH